MSNFTSQSRTLPKGTIFAHAKRNPLALLAPDDEMAQGVGAALHTFENPRCGKWVYSVKKGFEFYGPLNGG